jgi:hypothetical protein
LNLFAYGRHLLVDNLSFNYNSAHVATAWQRTTRAHNSVDVNGSSQSGSTIGTMTAQFNASYDYLRSQARNYSGFTTAYRDLLFIRPQYIIVTDYFNPTSAGSSNAYSQNWHFLPNASFNTNASTKKTTVGVDGIELIIAPVGNVTDVKRNDGKYSPRPGSYVNTEYLSYTKSVAGVATYNTVLYPYKAGDRVVDVATSPLTVESLTNADVSSFKVTITEGDATRVGQYYNLHETSKKAERAFGDYKTDGNLAYIEASAGGYNMAIMRNGKILNDVTGEDRKIIQAGTNIADIGVEWNGNNLYLNGSDLTTANLTSANVCVYMAGAPAKVYLNRIELPTSAYNYSASAAMVYFGNAPTGVVQPSLNPSVSVYPNPVKAGQLFFIKVENELSDATVSIYTISGVKISERNVKGNLIEQTIDQPGIYIVEITNDTEKQLVKVAIK